MNDILEEILQSPEFKEGVAWEKKYFKANDVVLKQGEFGQTLFVIKEGVLRVTGQVELDKHRKIQPGFCDLEKGSVFGEACLQVSGQRMSTIVAVTDGFVIEIEGARLSVFLDAHPNLGYLFYKKIFENFITRLNKANQRVEHLMAWGLKVHDIDKYL